MALARLVVLPLNYFLELGFFFYIAVIQWRRFRTGVMGRADRAAVLMLGTSVLVCTFLRSNQLDSNDLAWRGILLAQFVLLLSGHTPGRFRSATKYDENPDGHRGAKFYALAEGYAWIRQHTAPSDLIEPNPDKMAFEWGLQADRRVAVSEQCRAFSPDQKDCAALERAMDPVFSLRAPADGLDVACRIALIKMVVVEENDPVWHNAESWIWKTSPADANPFQRIYRCN